MFEFFTDPYPNQQCPSRYQRLRLTKRSTTASNQRLFQQLFRDWVFRLNCPLQFGLAQWKWGVSTFSIFERNVGMWHRNEYGNTRVGQLLLPQLQKSQLETGLSHSLLEEPSLHIAYLTPTWVLSMRQFMSNHNIWMTLTETFIIKLLGRNDRCIMDVQRLRGYSTRQQKDFLNLVRLRLQVSTLAELVDPTERNKIETWALEARRPANFRDIKAWPRQDILTHPQRRLWKRYPVAISQSTRDKLWEECQKKQKVTIATEGGLKGHQGTFGWVISTKANKVLMEGAGPVDGPLDTSNSTRCELGGYAASLIFLSLVHSRWGTKQHKCTFRWVTDSKVAITKQCYKSNRENT
ncbi:hypothetical protein MHU86_6471 [Fragilaria crotonensis]|nr:hypothetical protein MHU86_6471 [Fragilaria crotonensis]